MNRISAKSDSLYKMQSVVWRLCLVWSALATVLLMVGLSDWGTLVGFWGVVFAATAAFARLIILAIQFQNMKSFGFARICYALLALIVVSILLKRFL